MTLEKIRTLQKKKAKISHTAQNCPFGMAGALRMGGKGFRTWAGLNPNFLSYIDVHGKSPHP